MRDPRAPEISHEGFVGGSSCQKYLREVWEPNRLSLKADIKVPNAAWELASNRRRSHALAGEGRGPARCWGSLRAIDGPPRPVASTTCGTATLTGSNVTPTPKPCTAASMLISAGARPPTTMRASCSSALGCTRGVIRIPDEGLGLDSCAVAKRVGWCAMSRGGRPWRGLLVI